MLKKIVLLLILLFSISYCFGQKNEFDQIEKTIIKNDSILKHRCDFDQLIKVHLNNYYLSKSQGYKKGEVLSLINLANSLWNRGDNKNCLKILHKLEEDIYVKSNDLFFIKVLLEFGQCYANMELYKLALEYNSKAEKLIKNSHEISKKEKNALLNYSYGTTGFIHEINKSIDSAFYYNHKALKLNRTILLLSNTARLHAINNRIDSLQIYINEAKTKIETGTPSVLSQLIFYRVYGIYHQKIKKYEDSEIYLDKALVLSKKIKRYYAVFYSYSALINLHNETNDYLKSNKYQKELNSFLDSTKIIRTNYTNFAVEEMLKKKNEKIVIESKKTNKFLLITLIAISLLFISTFLYLKNKNKLNKKINELQSIELENVKLKESHEQAYIDLINALKKNDGSFISLFEKKYESFYKTLIIRHPNLSKTELILCALVRLNLTSKEIAEYTFVQHKTVQTQKNRLRKKLGIPSDINLYNYFNNEF